MHIICKQSAFAFCMSFLRTSLMYPELHSRPCHHIKSVTLYALVLANDGRRRKLSPNPVRGRGIKFVLWPGGGEVTGGYGEGGEKSGLVWEYITRTCTLYRHVCLV